MITTPPIYYDFRPHYGMCWCVWLTPLQGAGFCVPILSSPAESTTQLIITGNTLIDIKIFSSLACIANSKKNGLKFLHVFAH